MFKNIPLPGASHYSQTWYHGNPRDRQMIVTEPRNIFKTSVESDSLFPIVVRSHIQLIFN